VGGKKGVRGRLDIASAPIRLETAFRRLNRNEALKKVRRWVKENRVSYTKHAEAELTADGLESKEAREALLEGRILMEAELIKGTYRYRVEGPNSCVVVAFEVDGSETSLKVITAWRRNR